MIKDRESSENKDQHLKKLKFCLIHRGHSEDCTMTKRFAASFENQNELTNYITFAQTYNLNTKFNKNIINNSKNDFLYNSLKKPFVNKNLLLVTKQAKSL